MDTPSPRRGPLRPPIVAVAALAGVIACAGACALLASGGATGAAQASPATLGEALGQAVAWEREHPWLFGVGFFLLFTAMAAVPLPGCSVLALAAGAWWGWLGGAAVVTLASSVGATIAFLAARHVGRDAVQRRWGHRLRPVEAMLERHGCLLVFWLRLAPLVPYPVLNPLLGLTRLPAARFFGASAAGMFAGSALYAWLGAELGHAADWRDLLTPPVLAAVAALMTLPLALRAALARRAPALVATPAPAGADPAGTADRRP
jgi:uncharacterized membrane protein YdjX (TVP38/TMEM64 family)